MDKAEGIDVSHHHPVTDWAAVVAAGMTIFGAKATEGNGHVDPTFARHRDGARDQPFELLVYYHFARPGSPRAQADHLVATVGELRANERLALDVEADQDGRCPAIEWIDAFVEALPDDRRHLVYTSSRVWRELVGAAAWPNAIETDLWAPRYGSTEPNLPVDLGGMPVWPRWTLWQDREDFVCPGVDGPCDHSVFRGGADELRRYATLVA